jgi:phosphonate transport system permease protein
VNTDVSRGTLPPAHENDTGRSPQVLLNHDILIGAGVIAVLTLLLGQLGLFDAARLSRGAYNLVLFARETFPPDTAILPQALSALWETIHMALAGTLLGFLFAIPLGFLGARNLTPRVVVYSTRVLVGAIRTVPSLLWAVIFVITVGLGPLAGTLALAVYTAGYLAKLYAETFEAVDPEILEAVAGLGARPWHLARFVVWHESANNVLSQLLFMIEYNIRASAILGFVGAGGIGLLLNLYINTLAYNRVAMILVLILIVVLGMDVLSRLVRKRFLLTK